MTNHISFHSTVSSDSKSYYGPQGLGETLWSAELGEDSSAAAPSDCLVRIVPTNPTYFKIDDQPRIYIPPHNVIVQRVRAGETVTFEDASAITPLTVTIQPTI